MALNPRLVVGPRGPLPAGYAGEFYCMERDHMHISLRAPGLGSVEGKGRIVLTNMRIVAIYKTAQQRPAGGSVVVGSVVGGSGSAAAAAAAEGPIAAVDVPLQGIEAETFKQPIFGANYLTGIVHPVPGGGLQAPATFRLAFHNGGEGTTLRILMSLLAQIRAGAAARAALYQAQHMQTVISQLGVQQDPGDPSHVFLSQPAASAWGPSAPPAAAGAPPGTAAAVTASTAGDDPVSLPDDYYNAKSSGGASGKQQP